MFKLNLPLEMLPGICRNTPVGRKLTEKMQKYFQIGVWELAVPFCRTRHP
jgi:hypothetical protein